MKEEVNTDIPAAPDTAPAGLRESAQRGRLAWQRLWLRLRSVTPAGVVRALLVLALLATVIWLIARAGASMLPFWVGIILAYATLPFVNWLDRFIPRLLAILLLLAIEVLIVGLVLIVLVPIFAGEVVQLVQSLPDVSRVQLWLAELEAYLMTLPRPAQDFLDGWLRNAYNTAKLNFTDYLIQFVSTGSLTALNTVRIVTFVLSFLIIPTWLVSVLQDQRQVRRSLDNTMPPAMRADFWAVIRIIDRTFNAFVSGQLVIALLVGTITYAGLRFIPWFAVWNLSFPLALAIIAAVFNLIPIVGAIVGVAPLALVALSISWQLAVGVILLYVLAVWLVSVLVAPRLRSRAVTIHPAVLAPVVVLGSTFGFLGAVLAGPLATVTRDLFRYAYGRFEDPPRPAGLLPGDTPAVRPLEQFSAQRVPLRQARRLAAERPIEE
jgi:predicted PurR-regulated permease PerM